MNANERKCFSVFSSMSYVWAINLSQASSVIIIRGFLFAFIRVMHMEVQMPQAQRPPWMAEGRATQEQLPRCAGAAHLRTYSFKL